ncbi:tol-pal system protein YbgF [Aliikangiella maris]|uniref:Tol-pal system protein YbgF n=2 Tax=Aliikangiella maris TaxID=3162458 RepID=A0ABV3MQK6_9GAMM
MKVSPIYLVAALAATTSLSVFAQSQLSVEQRLQYLEQQLQTKTQLQAQMNQQLSALQDEVKELRGLVEEHGYQLNQIQERQRDLYRDIENRLSALPRTAVPTAQSSPPSTTAKTTRQPSQSVTTPTASGSERDAFEAAFKLVRNRQYSEAIKGFEEFLTQYPQGSFSDNARFWIGQVYFAQSNLVEAEKQFNLLRQDFPESTKLSTALLKLAEIKTKQGNWEEAKSLYNEIINNYGGAQQQLARKGLQELKQAGH